jgi:hypothetical protein
VPSELLASVRILYLLYVARDVINWIYQLLYFTATLNGQYSAHSSVQPAQ